MLTYNSYYKRFKTDCWDTVEKAEKINGKKWWDKNAINDDVNDMPILENKTGVNNSEWKILHCMIMGLFISYVNSHPIDNETHSYALEINLLNGQWRNYINNMGNVSVDIPDSDTDYSYNTFKLIDDKKIIDSFDMINENIYFFISEFIRRNRDNIHVKITNVFLRMDNLENSLEEGKWIPPTESSLTFYNGDNIIVCSM